MLFKDLDEGSRLMGRFSVEDGEVKVSEYVDVKLAGATGVIKRTLYFGAKCRARA